MLQSSSGRVMTTGAFSQKVGKLFSEFKLATDNLLRANWETAESEGTIMWNTGLIGCAGMIRMKYWSHWLCWDDQDEILVSLVVLGWSGWNTGLIGCAGMIRMKYRSHWLCWDDQDDQDRCYLAMWRICCSFCRQWDCQQSLPGVWHSSNSLLQGKKTEASLFIHDFCFGLNWSL